LENFSAKYFHFITPSYHLTFQSR